jgi:hypothetical protein
MKRWLPALLLAVAASVCLERGAAHAQEITDRDVDEAVEKGVAYLRRQQDANGSFGAFGNYQIGPTALAAFALLSCEVPPDDPAIAGAINYGGSLPTDKTYELALYIMMLQAADPKKYYPQISRAASILVNAQRRRGGWWYSPGTDDRFDNSNTQYAMLGLYAARLAGYPIDERVFERARDHCHRTQHHNGSWSYQAQGAETGSMTTGALSSLLIADEVLNVAVEPCGSERVNRRLENGFAWLGSHFSVTGNPGSNANYYYYMYGLERAGVLSGRKFIGGHDWYREGSARLLDLQRGDGSWGNINNTAFALLFLAKGRAPAIMTKLEWDGDWNNFLHDVNNLARFTGEKLHQPLSWQTLDTAASLDDFLAAPILYLNGKNAPKFTAREKDLLKQYIANGGFLFAEACCGTKAFQVGFGELARELYPNERLKLVPPDHPIFNAPFVIRPVPTLFSIGFGCRDYVLFSPKAFAQYWEQASNEKQALELGTNIIAYATGYERLRHKLKPIHTAPTPKKTDKLLRGGVTIGLIKLAEGGAETSSALDNLLALLSERAGLTVASRRVLVSLRDPDLFNYPLIYMTSKGSFTLEEDELQNLRTHLERGGFLFADPICGNSQFDRSFRAMLRALYPGKALEMLPLDHPVFSSAYAIEKVSYKKKVREQMAGLDTPVLEALSIDGRIAVIYSKYNFSNGLEGVTDYTSAGYEKEDAIKIAVNIVVYALRH